MKTITVDDRQAVVNMMRRTLKKLDPDGEHEGTTDPEHVIRKVSNEFYDVAFIDVEMPKMNGIQLARKLQEIEPIINIIFITGYMEYMPQAFELYASGYLMKPVTEKDVMNALSHLRYSGDPDAKRGQDTNIRAICFGTFEVYIDDVPVRFHRGKCKEMFAYLIDRKGAVCSTETLTEALWPDKEINASAKSLTRTVAAEMIKDFASQGAEDVVIRGNGGIAVNLPKLNCDYFDFLRGNPYAIHAYMGEYMSQYEFAEETRERLKEETGR